MRPLTLLALIAILALVPPALAGESPRQATLYKTPGCGCCEGYADYLRENGFEVAVEATDELPQIKRRHGIPAEFEGCHTTLLGGYVVEGHVPVATLLRLLAERPAIRGVSLPGMPAGSPGMSGEKTEPFTVYELSDGDRPKVYAIE